LLKAIVYIIKLSAKKNNIKFTAMVINLKPKKWLLPS